MSVMMMWVILFLLLLYEFFQSGGVWLVYGVESLGSYCSAWLLGVCLKFNFINFLHCVFYEAMMVL